VFYGNLVHDFCREILEGEERSQGDFEQSARVQEIINAVALSHRERRWVSLPLAAGARDAQNQGERGGARG
jgi:predicted dehydrogenase